MAATADWARGVREEAWAFGRRLRDDLLGQYQREYGVAIPPPPAKIVDELLTDFLQAELHYLPLADDRFAETRWDNGKAVVRVNTLTASIPGVKDAEGVQNVAKWHEAVHVVHDLQALRVAPQALLPGFEGRHEIACYRTGRRSAPVTERHREFWAEEAGRAAAVSLPALARSDTFRRLPHVGLRCLGPSLEAWPLLYQAAEDIGVNISALVRQLSLEDWIVVAKEEGRERVYVQPALAERMDAT